MRTRSFNVTWRYFYEAEGNKIYGKWIKWNENGKQIWDYKHIVY